jgi:hypothetical protein
MITPNIVPSPAGRRSRRMHGDAEEALRAAPTWPFSSSLGLRVAERRTANPMLCRKIETREDPQGGGHVAKKPWQVVWFQNNQVRVYKGKKELKHYAGTHSAVAEIIRRDAPTNAQFFRGDWKGSRVEIPRANF